VTQPAASVTSRWRFAVMLGAFVAFTALAVYWTMPPAEVLERALDELVALGAAKAALMIVLAIAVLGVEMIRMIVFGRAIGVRVPVRAAFDASIANDLFSWISPGAMLGEPAAVYVMARRGVPVDAALAISFGKFATSFALFMGLAALLLGLGYGPALPRWAVIMVVLTIGFGVLLVGSFVIGSFAPAASQRLVDRLERRLSRWLPGPLATRAIQASANVVRRSIDRLAVLRTVGAGGWLAIAASHVLYYGSYVGLLVVLAALFGADPLTAIVPLAILYQAFTYIAPAPGIPEAGAAAFFGGALTDGNAFVVVLLFRALTAYFQIGLALIYLPGGGMLRALLDRSRS